MNYFKILLLSSILLSKLIAGQDSDRIFLKNGQIYTFSITEVNNWGLRFSNDNSCLYRVISKIETNKSNVVSEVQNLFPDVMVSQSDSIYTLDLNAVVIKEPKPKADNRTSRFSIKGLVEFNSQIYTEIRFSLKPRYLKNLVNEFSYIADWYFSDYKESITYNSGFSFGVGAYKKISVFEASILLNYLFQSSYDEGEGSGYTKIQSNMTSNESIYLSTNLHASIAKKIFFSLSWNYYFNEIRVIEDFRNNLFLVGIGVHLYENDL